jgi:hypothetical protein
LYASYAKIRHPDKRVRGCWITNEKKEYTCDILYDDAIQTVAAYVEKKGLLIGFNPIDRQTVNPVSPGISKDPALGHWDPIYRLGNIGNIPVILVKNIQSNI